MKRIAVICALPPERNTGMATVDLSAHSVIRRLAPGAEITLYTYGRPNQYTYKPGELPYQLLNIADHAERYLSSDIFIYWGDFIHARSYWKFDRGAWDEKAPAMSADEFAQWQNAQYEIYSKYIFLSALPDARLKNAVVFGSTIITNDAADQADKAYFGDYTRFFSGAGAVYFRDALSAAKVSPLRDDEATLACDCALLLEDSDLSRLPGFQAAPERRGIGVFFGRSSSKLQMMLFSLLVGRCMKERCSWLPWFSSRRRVRWLARPFGYRIRPGDADPGALLSSLSGYRFIITDTYHLCVNAWRLGIPAICIGQGAGMSVTSLGDKKKEIFYEMYGARRFYAFLESLGPARIFSTAAQAAGALADDSLVSQVSWNISLHRQTALRRLQEAISRLPGAERQKNT